MFDARCLWCSYSKLTQSQLYEFVVQSSGGEAWQSAPKWMRQAGRDLCVCFDCVEVFHQALSEAACFDDRFKADGVRETVYKGNVGRITEHLNAALENYREDLTQPQGGLFHDDSLSSLPSRDLFISAECSIREALKYPRLLLSRDLTAVLVEVFDELMQASESVSVSEKSPGVYLLLVHPVHEVSSTVTPCV